MKINVSGQHMDLGDAFRNHIEDSLKKNVKKYFENAVNANVALSKDRHHLFSTEIVVNEGTGTGVVIKGDSQDADAYRSFDVALAKIEKQLRRYKSRIKEHQKDKEARLAFYDATKYIMSPFADGDDSAHHMDAPAIIAEMETKIEKLSVGDAVMKMDLLDVPALMFINAKTGRINQVYYRKDGNIAWVDNPQGH
jgi:ribosomal subunit interface protein